MLVNSLDPPVHGEGLLSGQRVKDLVAKILHAPLVFKERILILLPASILCF